MADPRIRTPYAPPGRVQIEPQTGLPAGPVPRLPSLGGMVPYDAPVGVPPPPVPPPVLGEDQFSEAFSQKVDLPTGQIGPEVLVYQTKRRWAACDVYVTPPQYNVAFSTATYLCVRVYAGGGAGRALVAQGILNYYDKTATGTPRPRWVCAARALTEVFEVTITPLNIPAGASVPTVVSVVASNFAPPPPDDIGVALVTPEPVNVAHAMPWTSSGTPGDLQLQLHAVAMTNRLGAIKFFQAVDAPDAATVGTGVVMLSIGIPAGQTLLLGPEQLRNYRFGALGCVIGMSTAATTFVDAYSGGSEYVYQVWAR